MTQKYLSHKQARELLGVSRYVFDRYIRPKVKELRYGKRGGRFLRSELEQILGPSGLNAEDIRRDAKPFRRESGVYFLFQGKELVYIGQSWHVPGRLIDHIPGVNGDSEKTWNLVSVIEAPPEDLVTLERKFLREHQPKYNRYIKS